MTATSFVPVSDADESERNIATTQAVEGGVTVERYRYEQEFSGHPTYTVTTAAVLCSPANSHLIELMAGDTNTLYLRRIALDQVANAATATPGKRLRFSLYSLDTAGTGGTVYTPEPMDPSDDVADATAMTLPSVKGEEGVGGTGGLVWGGAADVRNPVVGSTGHLLDWRWGEDGLSKCPIIPPGTSNGLAIKNLDADTSATVIIVVEFVLLPY